MLLEIKGFNEKVNELIEFINKNKRLPTLNKNEDKNTKSMYNFMHCTLIKNYTENKIEKELLNKVNNCELLINKIKEFIETRKNKLSTLQKIDELIQYINKNKKTPLSGKQKFTDNIEMYGFMSRTLINNYKKYKNNKKNELNEETFIKINNCEILMKYINNRLK